MKAYFLQRVMAYLIDVFIVAILLVLIKGVVPIDNNYESLRKESEELSEKLVNKKISAEDYLKENGRLSYDIQKATYMWSITDVSIYLLYFVCFQTYFKKQTIGKMLMKITIKKKDGSDLSYNDSLKRSLILHGLFVSIVTLILITFLKRSYYIPIEMGLEFLNAIVFFVTMLMVIFRKDGRGLHDLFAKTEVMVYEEALPEVISLKEVAEGIDDSEISNVTNDVEEGSNEDEGTSRTRSRKKRKSNRDK